MWGAEDGVEDAGELVGGGGDGFGGAELGASAAEEGAEGGLAAMKAHGGDAEGGSGAADGWTSAEFEDLAEPRSGIHSGSEGCHDNRHGHTAG